MKCIFDHGLAGFFASNLILHICNNYKFNFLGNIKLLHICIFFYGRFTVGKTVEMSVNFLHPGGGGGGTNDKIHMLKVSSRIKRKQPCPCPLQQNML
jgi:hypothetical protein